jgi:hypothetical protein
MPTAETAVDKTLREVIGESVNTQTQKKSSDPDSTQTKAGDKREFVSGLDVSEIPDNMTKAEFKEFLAKKGKLLEDGYQNKFKEVAALKKQQENLLSHGLTPEEAGKIVMDAINNRKNTNLSDVKNEIKRREIEILKEEAPDLDTRKGVDRLGKIVHEEVSESPAYKELRERLEKAEKALGYYSQATQNSRVENLNKALDELSGSFYDKNFIDNNRDKIIAEGKKFPDAPVKKIIAVISDPDELHEAILKTKNKNESKESRIKEKINANDSASSGVTGSDRQIDIKKVSLKGLLSQVMSQKS